MLDRRSRFDRTDLICGIAGAYFDNCLIAGGQPGISRQTVEVRTLEHVGEDYLPDTKALLLLGPETLSYFKEGVTLDEQRGSPFEWNGMQCVATYNPQDADDRRDYFNGDDDDEDDKDEKETAEGKTTHGATQRKNWRFWMRQDIKKAVRLARTIPLSFTPLYHFWPQSNVVIALLESAKAVNFYFDVETDRNLQLTCFGFSLDEGRNIYVVPMLQTYLQPPTYYYGDTHLILRALALCLSRNRVVIHNSMFDLFVLAYRYHIPIGRSVYDTMLAHNRCYIEVEKSLGHVISLYTDLPYHKNEGIFEPKSYIQTQQLYEYNGKDILALTKVKPEIDKTAARLGATESIEQVNRMVVPYLVMTLQGIQLDTAKIDEIVSYHTRWNEQIKRLLGLLTSNPEFNPNSWQQVAKYLYEDLKIKRPDKDPTAEKTLLQLLLKKDVPAIYGILKYRGNQKRISKASLKSKKQPPRYYYGCYGSTNSSPRVTTSWRLGKTVTMRLGSSKLLRRWGDNLQNWEKMLRKCIVADRGKILLQIDQSGAEALIVAYLCRAGQFRNIFLHNVNPHSFLAMHLFQEAFEAELGYKLDDYVATPVHVLPTLPKWKDIAKYAKATDDSKNPAERYYFIAKQGNHSLNYDCKARAFRLNCLLKSEGALALTIDDAQRVIDKRMGLFPEIPAWHQDVVKVAKQTNILRNLFNHPRVITQRIEEPMYKELYAFIPQSTVGQITNYAITEMQEQLEDGDTMLHEAGVDVLQNNHDSMLLQCWNDPKFYYPVAAEMRKHFNRRLVSPRGEVFYMKSEVQIGDSWGHMEVLQEPKPKEAIVV